LTSASALATAHSRATAFSLAASATMTPAAPHSTARNSSRTILSQRRATPEFLHRLTNRAADIRNHPNPRLLNHRQGLGSNPSSENGPNPFVRDQSGGGNPRPLGGIPTLGVIYGLKQCTGFTVNNEQTCGPAKSWINGRVKIHTSSRNNNLHNALHFCEKNLT
jgi:hypothetical protein